MAAAVALPPVPTIYSKEDETLLVFVRLMEGGQEDEETCRDLDTLTALLNEDSESAAASSSHSTICSVIDVDLVDTMLSYLDLRQPDIVRARSLLTTSAYLRAAGEQGEENLAVFFRSRVQRGTYDDYIVAFCVAASIFPIVPQLTSRLFLAEGFLSSLGPLMRRKWKSRKVETACLEMLNAACMNPECRDAVDKYCSEWLEEVVEQDPAEVVRAISQDPELQMYGGGTVSLRRHSEQVLNLAAVILTKLRAVPKTPSLNRPERQAESRVTAASTSVEELSATFCRTLKAAEEGEEEDPVCVKHGIEGLAYASLRPGIKESIARDEKLLRRIVKCLGDANAGAPVTYGALSILVNLTRYRPVLSEEEDKIRQLKAYANAAGKPSQPRPAADPLNSAAGVSERCRLVFTAGTVPALVAHFKNQSAASLGLTVSVLHALSVTPALRGPLAQQGAVRLLLAAWARLPESEHAARRTAAQATSRILISINPALVFGGNAGLSPLAAVRPLVANMGPDPDPAAETRDLLPAFESLMALTNIASLDDPDTRRMIVTAAAPAAEELMLSSNVRVSRAAVELVCNLAQSPEGASLYADGSAKARDRLHILLALADAPDEGIRSAAGGALAGATAHEGVVRALCARDGGVRAVLGLCADPGEPQRHRGAVIVANMVSTEGETGKLARKKVREENGAEKLKQCAERAETAATLEAVAGAVEYLTRE